MLGRLAGLLGVTKFIQLSDRACIELTDPPISFRERSSRQSIITGIPRTSSLPRKDSHGSARLWIRSTSG